MPFPSNPPVPDPTSILLQSAKIFIEARQPLHLPCRSRVPPPQPVCTACHRPASMVSPRLQNLAQRKNLNPQVLSQCSALHLITPLAAGGRATARAPCTVTGSGARRLGRLALPDWASRPKPWAKSCPSTVAMFFYPFSDFLYNYKF
jgi:hypothetical protein